MRIRFYHSPCLVLSLVLSCLSLNLKATPTELGAFEKMRYLYLENGMEVVLLENHNAPVIASVVIVKTGLHFEQPEINGASHYLEHLLFNGTTTRTQKQLYDDIDRIGGYNNAHTDRDYTNFI